MSCPVSVKYDLYPRKLYLIPGNIYQTNGSDLHYHLIEGLTIASPHR